MLHARDLRDRTDADLRGQLDDLHEELRNLRFQLATRQLANYKRIHEVKKDIARVNTVLHERALAAAYADATA